MEPEFTRSFGEDRVKRAKVVGLTQKRPESPRRGTVTVKLTLRIPESAFLPLRPEAIVVIPDEMTQANPIEVIAQEPL